MALHDIRKEHMAWATKLTVGGSVATGLLKISPDFFRKKANKNSDKETKYRPTNTSKINP